MVGIGFTDEMATEFAETVKPMERPLYSTDVAGWDRTLGRDFIINASEMVISKIRDPHRFKALIRAIRVHARLMTNPLFIVPSDCKTCYLFLARSNPGGMLSGSFLTTLYNTIARLDVAYVCGAKHAKAAGDDCLEHHEDDKESVTARYAKLNLVLREVNPLARNEVNFCSHTYTEISPGQWKASLDSWPKALYKALTHKLDMEKAYSLEREVRNNDNKEEIVRCLYKYGTFIKPLIGSSD